MQAAPPLGVRSILKVIEFLRFFSSSLKYRIVNAINSHESLDWSRYYEEVKNLFC